MKQVSRAHVCSRQTEIQTGPVAPLTGLFVGPPLSALGREKTLDILCSRHNNIYYTQAAPPSYAVLFLSDIPRV